MRPVLPLLVALFVSLPVPARAQDGTLRVSVPSPTAASLGTFGDVPVSLHSGLPTISIPLWTARGRTLELPISLDYKAGGIRVEEVGGWVGMGWALEAGGVITRTVRGLVDESSNGYYHTGSTFYQSGNWSSTAPASLLQDLTNGIVDGEPDQFFFNFAGRSGQFVMGPTDASGTVKEIRTIPYHKMRIEPTIVGYDITKWTVTAEDGTRYTFAAVEETTEQTWNNSGPGGTLGTPYNSSWHLTEIRSPGGDVMTLHYSPYTATHTVADFRERFAQITNSCVPFESWNQTDATTVTQRLDSIVGAAETVRFVVSNVLRSDALSPSGTAQEPRLYAMDIRTPVGTLVKRFTFGMDYFSGNRNRLAFVHEEDPNGNRLPPYTFTYDSQTFPARNSYDQDHGGYWNNAGNSTLVPEAVTPGGTVLSGADRSPNPARAQVGSLTRVTYPTGGYSEFVWEGNDYGYINSGTGLYEGAAASKSVSSNNQATRTTTFTVSGASAAIVTFRATALPTNCDPNGTPLPGEPSVVCPYAKVKQGTQVLQSWTSSATTSLSLSPGTYTMEVFSDPNGSNGLMSLRADWEDRVLVKVKDGTGLRIAELRTGDGMGNVQVTKYDYRMASDPARSSGIVSGEPRYTYQYSTSGCSYFSRTTTSRLPLGSSPAVNYREVTVTHGASGEFGTTRERFRTQYEQPDADPSPTAWPFLRGTSYAWMRGQPLHVEQANASGLMQRTVSRTYSFRNTDTVTYRSFRAMSIRPFPGSNGGSAYIFHPFEVISAWYHPASETVTTSSENGVGSYTTVKDYEYGNSEHAQITETREAHPDGKTRIERWTYPLDYAPGGSGNPAAKALTRMMFEGHQHSAVVEHSVSEKDSGGIERALSAELTVYNSYQTWQHLPFRRYTLIASSPAGALSPASLNGSFTMDPRYEFAESISSYDLFGRVTTVLDRHGTVTNYRYGGNAKDALIIEIGKDDPGSLPYYVSTFTYDANGRLATAVRPGEGDGRSYEWDSYGRLTSVHRLNGPALVLYTYAYSRTSANNWTFDPVNPNALVTFTYLTASGDKVITTDHLDGLGRSIQHETPQPGGGYAYVTREYDLAGRVKRTWNAYTRSSPGYDPSFSANAKAYWETQVGSPAEPYTDSLYTPDPQARIDRIIRPYVGTTENGSITFKYDVDPSVQRYRAERTDEDGKRTRLDYDAFGHLLKNHLGYGTTEAGVAIFATDLMGRRTIRTDPRGFQTTFQLDTRGLVTQKHSPESGTTSFKYDVAGRLRFSQDANQSGQGTVFFQTYDFAGRPLVSGVGGASFATLDPDAASPTPLESDNDHWVTLRAYDATPDTTQYPWSVFASRIKSVSQSNLKGQLSAVASRTEIGAWQIELFTYDDAGYPAAEHIFTQPTTGGSVHAALDSSIEWTRDLRGEITYRKVTVSGAGPFHQWYDYNERGLLWKVFSSTSASAPTTPDVTYIYRPSGALASRQFAGEVAVPYLYTIRGEVSEIGDVGSITYPFAGRYFYNANGTMSEAHFRSAGSPATYKSYRYRYTYDALNRLIIGDYSDWTGSTFNNTVNHTISVEYDKAGNITSLERYFDNGLLQDNLTLSYATGSNRLTYVTDGSGATAVAWDVESGGFTYDANGNVRTAPEPYALSAAVYDHRNLPTSMTSSGVTSIFRYNGDGMRIAKKEGTAEEEFYLYDGTSVVAVLTVSGSPGQVTDWHFNILAGDKVIGRQAMTGGKRFYHTDLLGSTRAVTSGSTILESYDYDPYGLLMPGRTLAGTTTEGFTSKERDAATQLDYFGARYYMPALGRWTSMDPLADSFPAWNGYNYVEGNPVARLDAFGLCPEDVTGRPCLNPLGEAELQLRSELGAFGQNPRRIAGTHGGVDLLAPVGSDVTAADGGTIEFRNNEGGLGTYAVVWHGGGSATIYGHLSAYAEGLKSGDKVEAGQLIGHAGQSGNAGDTEPHLHFEIWTDFARVGRGGTSGRRDPWPELMKEVDKGGAND